MNGSIEHYIPEVKNNNELLSVLSKLVKENRDGNNKSMKDLLNVDVINQLTKIVNTNIEKSRMNEDILKLFPDTEKCIQIIVSSIVCPNDLITTNINYNLDNLNLPVELSTNIVNYVKKYIEKNYDLESNLYKIIKETLFLKGSYAQIVIPENLLDNYINKSDITINNVYGNNHIFNIGNTTYTVSKESLDPKIQSILKDDIKNINCMEKDLNISIEDTPFNLISFKRNIKYAKNLAKNDFYKIANENLLEIEDIFKEPEELDAKDTYIFNTFGNNRESVTKPLVMNVNSEYLIPIYVKGDPSSHIGYFLLTDENYNPINANGTLNGLESYCSNTYTNSSVSSSSYLITKARESLYGMIKNDPTYEEMELVYSNMLENLLKDKINNSKLGNVAQIGNTEEIYKIMFSRSIRNNETKLIYLPEEMVVYYAHEYRINGTGKSVLEDLAVICSIRAINFFARVMATVRNSINTTTFKIKLDDNDLDPQSTIDDIVSSIMESYQLSLPIGLTNITNLAEWAYTLGKEFVFEHPRISNIEVDKSNVSGEKIVPDSDLDEKLFEQVCLRCGVTADMVRSGFENDFATTVVTKNLLFAKEISLHHIWVNKCISNHVKKLLLNDPIVNGVINSILSKEIKKVKKYNLDSEQNGYENDINYKMKENELVKLLTFKIIDTIECSLPAPEIADATSLAETFDKERGAAEKFLDSILSDEILPDDLAGESGQYITMIKSMVLGLYSIDWANKNGLYKNIMDLILDSPTEEGNRNKLSQSYRDIRDKLASNTYALLKDSVKFKRKYGEKIEKLEEELAPEPEEDEIMDTDFTEDVMVEETGYTEEEPLDEENQDNPEEENEDIEEKVEKIVEDKIDELEDEKEENKDEEDNELK